MPIDSPEPDFDEIFGDDPELTPQECEAIRKAIARRKAPLTVFYYRNANPYNWLENEQMDEQ